MTLEVKGRSGTPSDPHSANGAPAIVLQDVHAAYADGRGSSKAVLSGVSLEIPRGQFVAVVGRSGCGKTTILNLLAGLVTHNAGHVAVAGQSPRDARPKIGMMFARDALLPWRTALGNAEYGLELRGSIDRAERRRRAMAGLEAVQLAEAANLWPWQMSQGMRQRVALARTWALDPEILLMDEPFAALDATTRESVQAEFLRLWQSTEGRTVLFVTHDLREAIALADRVVLLGSGTVLDDVWVPLARPRNIDEVDTTPAFVELLRRLRAQLH